MMKSTNEMHFFDEIELKNSMEGSSTLQTSRNLHELLPVVGLLVGAACPILRRLVEDRRKSMVHTPHRSLLDIFEGK